MIIHGPIISGSLTFAAGGTITLPSSTTYTGGLVSGSSQITLSSTTGYDANEHFTQGNITTVGTVTSGNVDSILPSGVISGSVQVDGSSVSTNNINIGGVSIALGGNDATPALNLSDATQYPGDSNLVTLGTVTAGSVNAILPDGIVSASAQLTSDFDTRYLNTNGDGVVSGSAQIDGTAITNNTISGVALGSNLNNLTVDDSTIALNSGTTYNGSAARTVSIKSGGITNTHINASAAIDHTKIDFGGSGLTSGSLGLTISDGSSTDSVQVGVDTLSVVGTANEIETAVTDNQIQVGIVTNPTLSGNVTVTGNLSVEGTTTTIDSTTVNIGDRVLELNYGGASGDAGLLVSDAVGGATVSGSLLWDASEDHWMAGALGGEKEIALLNAAPTSNTVLKANASGLLVDSLITDDGTDVTISGTAELRINAATANSFVYFDSNKSLESVAPSTAGDVIQWNGSSFVASNEIDGGTF